MSALLLCLKRGVLMKGSRLAEEIDLENKLRRSKEKKYKKNKCKDRDCEKCNIRKYCLVCKEGK